MINFFLVNMDLTEKFKESIDKGNALGALLTDLSKAFDCIDHTLLIAINKIALLLFIESDSANENQRKF